MAPAKKLSQMNLRHPWFAISQVSSVIDRNGSKMARYGTAAIAAAEAGQPAVAINKAAAR